MKRITVCGGGGFVGGWLIRLLKGNGCWVRSVDLKEPEFAPTGANEELLGDLRNPCVARAAVRDVDEVYQLAADFGGMGYIGVHEAEIVLNNTSINLHVLRAAAEAGVGRYFFSSSVCAYCDMMPGDLPMDEDDAYPAHPDNEYGWEKLYAERCALTVARHYPMKVRICRFENTYGPFGTWRGGREKAPAALCRKVALAKLKGEKTFPVWGDGGAVRSYTWAQDLVEGIVKVMASDLEGPVNLGSSEYVTVRELARLVVEASGADLEPEWVDGPVGVHSRNFSKRRAESVGAACGTPLAVGIRGLYGWVQRQVEHGLAAEGA